MQLVRTAQPKHKINLLSLSTEAGGPDVGHLVCSINSMQFVRTAQFKHKHLLALYSHSPRRTGGPQAPAPGALVLYTILGAIYPSQGRRGATGERTAALTPVAPLAQSENPTVPDDPQLDISATHLSRRSVKV